MRYEYKLTYQNYKDSQRLYRRHRWQAALSYYFWIWLVPVLGSILALPLLANLLFDFHPDWLRSIVGFSGVGLWFAVFIPLMRFYTIRRCWKRLLPENVRKSIRTDIPVEIEWNNEQLISCLPGRSEGRFFWSAICDFAENEKLALIFVKKKQFIFVPKSALPESAWADLRSRLANKPVTV
jgi:YcxB-like protein